MSHIVEAIEVIQNYTSPAESETLCCTCYGTSAALGRGTKAILANVTFPTNSPEINTAVVTNDCSPWRIMSGSTGAGSYYEPEGEIAFGVSCGTTVNIDFDSSSSGGTGDNHYDVRVLVFVNGAVGADFYMNPSSDSASKSVSVTGGPCGYSFSAHGTQVRIYARSLYESPFDQDRTTTVTVNAEVTSIT